MACANQNQRKGLQPRPLPKAGRSLPHALTQPGSTSDNSHEPDKPLKRVGNPNWIKGGASPNPSGRTDKPIAMLARMHAPTAIKTLVAICKDEKAPQSARVSASQAILDRGYGRAATFSTTDTTQLKRAIDMTDDELAVIVAKSRLTVIK